MALRQVVLVSGRRATVSDAWIARWPEDIKQVLDEAPVSEPRSAAKKKSAAKKSPQKPAPEVPESNVGTGESQEEEAP